jgi:FtsZ-interacting cell division protein ZipA
MSELQLGLLVVGALVVAGVYVFNLVQQRRLRRQAERAFGNRHEDVLLKPQPSREPRTRVEPRLEPMPVAETRTEPSLEPAPAPASVQLDIAQLGDGIDFVAELVFSAPIESGALAPLVQRKAEFGKPVSIAVYDPQEGAWKEAHLGMGGRYGRARVALQLCNRDGAVSDVMLRGFRDAVQALAQALGARVAMPDADEAAVRAALLDQFCAEVDVVIGINVVSPGERRFHGAKIKALAESNGLKLTADGRYALLDERGEALCKVADVQAVPFRAETLSQMSTDGLTLELDLPRVTDGLDAFRQMVQLARTFATTLGGVMVDDNRVALTDAGLEKIRQEIARLQALMQARRIPAGGELALRLFS